MIDDDERGVFVLGTSCGGVQDAEGAVAVLTPSEAALLVRQWATRPDDVLATHQDWVGTPVTCVGGGTLRTLVVGSDGVAWLGRTTDRELVATTAIPWSAVALLALLALQGQAERTPRAAPAAATFRVQASLVAPDIRGLPAVEVALAARDLATLRAADRTRGVLVPCPVAHAGKSPDIVWAMVRWARHGVRWVGHTTDGDAVETSPVRWEQVAPPGTPGVADPRAHYLARVHAFGVFRRDIFAALPDAPDDWLAAVVARYEHGEVPACLLALVAALDLDRAPRVVADACERAIPLRGVLGLDSHADRLGAPRDRARELISAPLEPVLFDELRLVVADLGRALDLSPEVVDGDSLAARLLREALPAETFRSLLRAAVA